MSCVRCWVTAVLVWLAVLVTILNIYQTTGIVGLSRIAIIGAMSLAVIGALIVRAKREL